MSNSDVFNQLTTLNSAVVTTDGRIGKLNRSDLDILFTEGGTGPLSSPMTAAFWGTNHRGMQIATPTNREQFGLTFFTRPRLNLSDSNLVTRSLSLLASTDKRSIKRAIRAILDPYTSGTNRASSIVEPDAYKKTYPSDLIDPLNPFISILGNTLTGLSGWPDIDVDTYTSQEGLYKEQWAMVDGVVNYYGSYNLNATFKNLHGDPLGYLFYVWAAYASLAYEGVITPYISSIIENEIDYQTRIYRVILDPTRTKVTKIACCGAAFPTASNVGAGFNFNGDKPFMTDLDSHSVSFKCMGALYYDPIAIEAFNMTVMDFNPNMRRGTRDRVYDQIAYADMLKFNFTGYPYIDINTSELTWWIDKRDYQAIKQQGIIL